jgi:hypothetical protein
MYFFNRTICVTRSNEILVDDPDTPECNAGRPLFAVRPH